MRILNSAENHNGGVVHQTESSAPGGLQDRTTSGDGRRVLFAITYEPHTPYSIASAAGSERKCHHHRLGLENTPFPAMTGWRKSVHTGELKPDKGETRDSRSCGRRRQSFAAILRKRYFVIAHIGTDGAWKRCARRGWEKPSGSCSREIAPSAGGKAQSWKACARYPRRDLRMARAAALFMLSLPEHRRQAFDGRKEGQVGQGATGACQEY